MKKIDVATIIKQAATVAGVVETLSGTLRESREVIARESPENLAEFDAQVASARKPSQTAADAGARENAEGTGDD